MGGTSWYFQITNVNRIYHYKPSILGYPQFRKPPYGKIRGFNPSPCKTAFQSASWKPQRSVKVHQGLDRSGGVRQDTSAFNVLDLKSIWIYIYMYMYIYICVYIYIVNIICICVNTYIYIYMDNKDSSVSMGKSMFDSYVSLVLSRQCGPKRWPRAQK